jgi:hypothetical protein
MKKLSNLWSQANNQVRINKDRINPERANKWVKENQDRFTRFYETTNDSYQGSFLKQHVDGLKQKVVQ